MEEPKATSNSRKRPLENEISGIQNSPYYKMRAVLGDLRPHFIEVRDSTYEIPFYLWFEFIDLCGAIFLALSAVIL